MSCGRGEKKEKEGGTSGQAAYSNDGCPLSVNRSQYSFVIRNENLSLYIHGIASLYECMD